MKSVTNSPHLEPSLKYMNGSDTRNEMRVVRANWLPTVPMRSLRPSVYVQVSGEVSGKAR